MHRLKVAQPPLPDDLPVEVQGGQPDGILNHERHEDPSAVAGRGGRSMGTLRVPRHKPAAMDVRFANAADPWSIVAEHVLDLGRVVGGGQEDAIAPDAR